MDMYTDFDLFYPTDSIGKYIIDSVIRNGERSRIYKVYLPNDSDHFFAIKVFPYQTQEDIDNYNNERNILDQLVNDNVALLPIENFTLNITQQIEDEKNCINDYTVTFMCVVMNFFENYDLGYYYDVKNQQFPMKMPLKHELIYNILYQSLLNLRCIHSKGIIHRDIKPENFIVKSLSPLVIQLIDFEFSIQLDKETLTTSIIYGTSKYTAPEVIKMKPYGMTADIWSLGVMIYYFALARYPFQISPFDYDLDTILSKIEKHKDKLVFYSNIPIELHDLLRKMLTYDPTQRISANDALNHCYFVKYGKFRNESDNNVTSLTSIGDEMRDAPNDNERI